MLQDPLFAKSQYLQIDMLIPSRVLGILTQGRGLVSVVKNYYLYYATDPGAFHSFRHGKNYEKFVSILFRVMIFYDITLKEIHTGVFNEKLC